MFALPISKPRFKSIIFFIKIALKLSYFGKKMPNFWALGAQPQTPVLPAAGGFAPRPPLASGGWRLRPQTLKTAPPIVNFWLRAWLVLVPNHCHIKCVAMM